MTGMGIAPYNNSYRFYIWPVPDHEEVLGTIAKKILNRI